MKALLCRNFGPLGELSLEEVPDPAPGPGEVLVRVRAAALNFPDALLVQGLYQVRPPLPFSPGGEVAGELEAVGEGVTDFTPGERVAGWTQAGGLAEKCLLRAENSMALPEGMGFEEGAALTLAYCTSLHALADRGALKAGETLLVLGAAGGVGYAAIEIGKALGATVIAAASSPERLKLCREAGADHLIDYSREDLKAGVNAVTSGRGVDVVLDPVGEPHFGPALRSLGFGGRYLVVGFAGGAIPTAKVNQLLLQERSMVGVYWGDWAKRNPAAQKANLARLAAWFGEGRINPPVTRRYPLTEAKAALEELAANKIMGKAVVLP